MMVVVVLIQITGIISKETFHHGVIFINPGKYDALPQPVRDWLNSADPADMKLNKHIIVKEATDGEHINTHKLQFVNSDYEIKETVLVDHIPLSMIKDLIKEKEFLWPDNGVSHEEL